MGILDIFGRREPSAARIEPRVERSVGHGTAVQALSLNDPAMIELLRDGYLSATGLTVNVETALRNPAMFRACSLISNAIAMLPLNLIEKSTKKKAADHPLHRLLHRKPNDWQTAYDFRGLMQLRALAYGNAYALVVRSRDVRTGKDRVIRLVPLHPDMVTVTVSDDWAVSYKYQPKRGGPQFFKPRDILHIRGLSLDGITGLSIIRQARDAIGLALSAELAAGRVFKNGAFVDGVLESEQEMSDEAYNRLKESWDERYAGADNAGKTPILEGVKYNRSGPSNRDAQMNELRKLQVEEIGRISGVPRPLLMVDETSWGSGIEALGQFFVSYTLNAWFEAWQQAIEGTLLSDTEADQYEAKFNPGALLRGSMKDQAEFLAKALGAGGHAPWMHVDEVRDVLDLPEREAPPHTMMGGKSVPPAEGDQPKPKPKQPIDEKDDDDEE